MRGTPIVDFLRDRFAFHHEKRFFIAMEMQALFQQLAERASVRVESLSVSGHPVFKGTRFLPTFLATGEGENATYDVRLMMCSYGGKHGTLVSQTPIAHIHIAGATISYDVGTARGMEDLHYMGILPPKFKDFQRVKADIGKNTQAMIDRAFSFGIALGSYWRQLPQRNPL